MTVEIGRTLLARIDNVIEQHQVAGQSDNTPRFYCGASAIGKDCNRERWYDFRWASTKRFEGRMLRLFDRGHREETRFLDWLRLVNVEVRAFAGMLWYHPESDSYATSAWDLPQDDPLPTQCIDVTDSHVHRARAEGAGVKLKQWSFKAHGGHFSGHCDAWLRYVPGQEQFVAWDAFILGEFKTHSAKNFAVLAGGTKDRKKWREGKLAFPGQGVAIAYPEHMIQMQHYMHHMDLPLALYGAVNKDDDDLHFEFIRYDHDFYAKGEPIIRETIHSPKHPRRISNHPTWHVCKMCDHSKTCHYGEPMQKNCRTCIFSHPVDGGEWKCRKWGDRTIPREAQLVGCDHWTEIKD